jgi:hypothetical protein
MGAGAARRRRCCLTVMTMALHSGKYRTTIIAICCTGIRLFTMDCCLSIYLQLNDFDVKYRKFLLPTSIVLYFGRTAIMHRKITGVLHAPAGKVLTYLNLPNL